MDCEKCPYEKRINEMLEDIGRAKQKGSDARKDIYERLRKIETEIVRTDERYKSISEDLRELKHQQAVVLAKIEELSAKPAKRWDTAITGLVGSGIGAVVAFASQKLFGG